MKTLPYIYESSIAYAHNMIENQRNCVTVLSKFLLYSCIIHVVIIVPTQTDAIRWLGIYRLPRGADHPVDSKADRFTSAECYTASIELGLRRRQSWFCNHPKFGFAMLAVLRAAHAVGYHCPRVFSDRRWNCTSIHHLPNVSPELRKGTREQALVHAFSSAALLFEIGRYCALNKIRYCSCDEEIASQTLGDYLTNSNNNEALFYQSGFEMNEMNPAMMPVPSNSNPIADGQSTVSRYYWTGCSDNIRVAREYVAAFLGIPTHKIQKLTSADIERLSDLQEIEENVKRRMKRSFKQTSISGVKSKRQSKFQQAKTTDTIRDRRDFYFHWNRPNKGTRTSRLGSPMDYLLDNIDARTQYSSPNDLNIRAADPRRQPHQSNSNERRSQSQIRRILNRHNYLAGVLLMEVNQKSVCKCHGVSGSCAHRVCFRQLRRIDNEIMQNALKLRYLAAKHVTFGEKRQLIAKTFTGTGFVDELVKLSELVFSEHSPDYCNSEPHRGSVGTQGRKCTLTNTGTSHCLNMCCGRGYTNMTTIERVQCNCRMGDGFKVKCDQCSKEIVTQQCL